TKYKLSKIVGENPGHVAEELRRNLVQPIILGNGSKVSKVSKRPGANLAENEQLLVLTNKLTELPDMYGWSKANVEQFAKWTGIKVTYKGSTSGKVRKQSIDVGKS
ncbi:PASTA domain-containing protein, partial [Streptococcus agalactiae]|nr:PASTA domain-containing protein [Streptococcus agalactiae]